MQVTQQFLSKLALHSHLTSVEQGAILELAGSVSTVPAASEVMGSGALAGSVCLLLDGMVARVSETVEGYRQIAALFVPGDIPDLYALLLPETIYSLEAVCNTRILRVPKDAMKEVLYRYPMIAEALWRETLIDARVANEWILNLGQRQGRARVAHLICEIATRVVELRSQSFSFSLPTTQVQIGEATGMSPVHVNRVLQTLRSLAVVSQHRVQILDWPGLQTVAGFDAEYLRLPIIERRSHH